MSASVLTISGFGRSNPFADIAGIIVNVTASATVYASASGGLPIDLAPVLNQAASFSQNYINPSDVVGIVPIGLSANGYIPGALTFNPNNVTLVAQPGATVKPIYNLTSAPAWVRLNGIGASNASGAGLGQVADGANSDSFSFLLLVARSGNNS